MKPIDAFLFGFMFGLGAIAAFVVAVVWLIVIKNLTE